MQFTCVNHWEYPLTPTVSNYWVRLSTVSWIINAEICVIFRSLRLWQIPQTQSFIDNLWYHAKSEFINCFINLFLNILQKKTLLSEIAEVWEHYTAEGLGNWENFELEMITHYLLQLLGIYLYIYYHVNFTRYCKLTVCSRPIRGS